MATFLFTPTGLLSGMWVWSLEFGDWQWVPNQLLNAGIVRPRAGCWFIGDPNQKPTTPPKDCPGVELPPSIDYSTLVQRKAVDLRAVLRDLDGTADLSIVLAPLTKDPPQLGSFARQLADLYKTGDLDAFDPDRVLEQRMRDLLPEPLRDYFDLYDKDKVPPDLLLNTNPPITADNLDALLKPLRELASTIASLPLPDSTIVYPQRNREPYTKLPGYNPTYPTDRGFRPNAGEDRDEWSAIYRSFHDRYYECMNLHELDGWRASLPIGFHELYSLGSTDAAWEKYSDALAHRDTLVDEFNLDLRTCSKLPPGEEPPEEEPPEPEPLPAIGPRTFWTVAVVHNSQNYLPTICATGPGDADALAASMFPGGLLHQFITKAGDIVPAASMGIGEGNTGTPC